MPRHTGSPNYGAMYFIANAGDNDDHLFKFDGQNIVHQ